MPVGGDVTQFFLGLMGFLADSLRARRLPAWNDLWGYGFPGLAESQMGVYYPPHAILYGRLETETAYVVTLVLHTLWGGLGLFWAARRMGISGVGAALAASSWTMCGFFLVHLAHPWAYTTGCWMPWALGLAWSILAPGSRPGRAAPFVLSLVLVLQILPGHFQLAFQTQVVLGLMVVWATLEQWRPAGRGATRATSDAAPILQRAASVLAALIAVFPLAALQLWPTGRLAQLAGDQRDFEYLSGFAATPLHLVNYAAPGLFHRSPLWRPLVWDPFHTSPEEQLTYVGLVPLFLAGLTLVRQFRRDAAVRWLAVLALATLLLSLGPYAPGFRRLIQVPGFSFFRAPSRWGLVTALALALLAGKGFDACRSWADLGRSIRRFVIVMAAWVALVLGLIELAVLSTAKPGWPEVVRWFDRAFRAMPWTDDPSFATADPRFERVMAKARLLMPDPRIPPDLSLAHVLQKSVEDRVFTEQRWRIYGAELWETAALLAALWAIAGLSRAGGGRAVRAALLLITLLDLWVLGRHRLIDVGPLRPLVSQSRLLARLAREPRGTRVADPAMRNLPMLAGLAPVSAYRTLTLPAVEGLTFMAVQEPMSGPEFEPRVRAALRAAGAKLRVFAPIENRVNHVVRRAEHTHETIDDPALAGWLYGARWTADLGPWVRRFSLWRAPEPPVRAWLVPLTEVADPAILDEWSGDPMEILALLERAEPLAATSPRPEEWEIWVDAGPPAWVIVSQLADPQWKARWIGLEGQGRRDDPILPAFRKRGEPGGWQRVEVPGRGRWTLRLEYEPRDVAEGIAISTLAWLAWLAGALQALIRSGTRRIPTEPRPSGSGRDHRPLTGAARSD
jgi:hypothetical protein